jgi:hypothetical protein
MIGKKQQTAALCGLMLLLTVFGGIISVKAFQPPVAIAGGPYIADECQPILFDASGSYSPDDGTLDYRWNFDGTWTDWTTNPYTEYTWRDDYQGTIILEARANGLTAQDTAAVTVYNTPPYILDITGPITEIIVGDPVVVTVLFGDGDPRMDPSLDTHVATFYWGDNTSSTYDLATGVFEVIGTHAYTQPGVYEILIIILDEDGGQTTATFTVTIVDNTPPDQLIVDAGPDRFINEGSLFQSTGSFTSTSGTVFTATVNYGDGTGIQPLALNQDHTFSLSHHYCENGIYPVEVTVTKDGQSTASDTITVTVANVAPHIISLTGPPTIPISIGSSLNLNGVFTDPGCLDTHTVTILWDDGQTTTENLPVGVYTASRSHTYTTPGVYTITFIVTDDDGGSDTRSIETYVVVYDPNCGFVTGGGWIIAPPGSYPAGPSLSGRCNFGFVAKYKKGQSIPQGNTEFQFQLGDINFHSETYQWLVITGPKATFTGVGTINGYGHFGLRLTAIDGKISGGGGVDKFRIKIWDIDNGNIIVFDNNIGQSDDANPTTALYGGQITIHKA